MKKLLPILILLSFIAPTVTCLCAPASADVAMVCKMDKPSSCCCETEVQSPKPPHVIECLVPASVELGDIDVASTPVDTQLAVADSDSVPFKRSISVVTSPQIFLTHQSFLI